jgi:hypothetical protein
LGCHGTWPSRHSNPVVNRAGKLEDHRHSRVRHILTALIAF